MSIYDLFVLIVKCISLSFLTMHGKLRFWGINKATDKLDSHVINTQVLLQVNTVEVSSSLYRAFVYI